MSKDRNLYRQAGVDVERGDHLVEWLLKGEGTHEGEQRDPRVVSGVGGFAALFRPAFKGMSDPLLIASTDGVGTKVLLGTQSHRLEGLGQDLVAMCVNDLYSTGGQPLFFLDYFATGRLDDDQFKKVLSGIKSACRQTGMVLLGGETAEMPGLYRDKEFDLAGFVVGMVDGAKVLGANRVEDGDILVAIKSSGFHSNGYSLIRKWIQDGLISMDDHRVIEYLMRPTALYHGVPKWVEQMGLEEFHSLAHITGGGISGNLPRCLPMGAVAKVDPELIPTDPMMLEIFDRCKAKAMELEGVFNLGCGLIAVISSKGAAYQRFVQMVKNDGFEATRIGTVELETSAISQTEGRVVYESKS